MRLVAQLALIVFFASSSACGLLAGAVSNATKQEFDTDLFPDYQMGGEQVQPLQFQANASDVSPSFGIPDDVDTSAWGPVISAHIRTIDSGDTEGVFEVQVSGFTITSTQNLLFTIAVGSRDGDIALLGGETGDNPTSCSFAIAAGSNGSTLGGHITTCLVDWVRANGVPAQLDYHVTVTTTSQAGTLMDAGIPFAVEHQESFVAKRQLEQSCFHRNLQLPGGVLDNIQNIKLENLQLEGTGSASVSVIIDAWAVAQGNGSTMVTINAGLPANTVRKYVYDGKKETANDFNAKFSEKMPDWIKDTLDLAIAGADAERKGFVDSKAVTGCYTVFGSAPRTGNLSFKISGDAKFTTEKKK